MLLNAILVPTLALDLSLIERLANSVDYPIRDKVVINTGKPLALVDWVEKHPDWRVISYGRIGVAAAWNKAPQIWPEEHAWLIVNDDEEFQPGCLEKLCKAADAHAHEAPIIYVNEHDAFDVFVWTRLGVNTYGTFDENFFPAYFEDWEMRCRFALGGPQPYRITEPFPVKHGKPPAGPRYTHLLKQCEPLLRQYFEMKWGVVSDTKPKFDRPYELGAWVGYWTPVPLLRDRLQQYWDEFWNTPNPSVYE